MENLFKVKGLKKEDLKSVAEDLGELITPAMNIGDIKTKITENQATKDDPEFVHDLLETAVTDRKEGIEKQKQFELEKVKQEEEKIEKQKQFNLEKVKREEEKIEKERQFELAKVKQEEGKIEKERQFELAKVKQEEEKIEKERQFELAKAKQENDLKLELARLQATQVPNANPAIFQAVQNEENNKRKFTLPKLEFRKFGGDIKEWLPFWGQFSNIHKDEDIAPEDKFQYLLQATVAGSRAREVIESFPPTGENYSKAVDSLTTRFGKEDLLIEVYVRELIKLIISVQTQEKPCITYLYDKLESYMRALDTLGVTTDKCASILYPMVESCFPHDFLKAWNRSVTSHAKKEAKDRLDDLMNFLKTEVEGEERIYLAMQGFGLNKKKENNCFKGKKFEPRENQNNVPSAAGLFTSAQEQKTCAFCSGRKHSTADCWKARKMTVQERQAAIEKAHCCFLCLGTNHIVQKCRVKTSCLVCGKRHHILLCRSAVKDQVSALDVSDKRKESFPSQRVSDSLPVQDETLANISQTPCVLLPTLAVDIRGNGKKKTVRAIIDTASQRSYIKKTTAETMGYKPEEKEYLRHSLFGGESTEVCAHDVFKIFLSSLDGTYNCNFSALSQPVICETKPAVVQQSLLSELEKSGIQLRDIKGAPIEVLIGADVAGKLMTGKIEHFASGLVAVQFKLGWTVMGRTTEAGPGENAALLVTSMLSTDVAIHDLWSLDSLGITDPSEKKTKLELHESAKQHFLDTVTIEDDRYVVHLPWIEDHPPLSDNFELSLKRLGSTQKKLNNEGLSQDYDNVFQGWLQKGIIEEVPDGEIEMQPRHYLPHRHVVKENSTTRLRPVFDASAKQKGYPSLNECLETGLNLIELIPNILTRFRLYNIGVVSDIEKAFLQIGLHNQDRDFLRFLWDRGDGGLVHYRHCRVVFGVSSSPYLLGAVIQHHLKSVLMDPEIISSDKQDLVEKLMKSYYVDNCVTSVESVAELHKFINVATEVMVLRKFNLRGWEYTHTDNDQAPSTSLTNVLGMLWDRNEDTLQLNTANLQDLCFEKVTKKLILATAHRVFDPIGVTCPVVLLPKFLLQRTWKMKLNWEEEVDEDTKLNFLKWVSEIPYLTNLRIPRWLKYECATENCSLHFFCDASRLAYAVAVFVRVNTTTGVEVQLVQARARVAPTGNKETTIARLELLAATIGSRLAPDIIKEFQTEEVFFWTDSSTVLAWIQREECWGVFVHNRVQEIRRLTSSKDWRHVPGIMNPADLPSRGCSASQLLSSKWWEGPRWLFLPPEEWPKREFTPNEDEVAREKTKKVVSCLMTTEVPGVITNRISSFQRAVRVLGWIQRFVLNCKNPERRSGPLTIFELNAAEELLIFMIQSEVFKEDDKRLKSLNTFRDDKGIIRMKSGVFRREDTTSFRTPAILPNYHPLVKSLIMEEHKKKGHAGVSYVLNSLRERYWLVCGRRVVRSTLHSCVTCRRHSAKGFTAPTAPPPRDRVQDASVFQISGVDFAGPIVLRDQSKAWICLWTCAVYRAVHLELVTSLSTETFLLAFNRFVSRRRKPTTVYSDNGTNFVGAYNALKSIDFEEVSRRSSEERIDWKFIPPGAPWWGGWWERLIGMMKQILKKVLGQASLNYEEMSTVLCTCEAILNDRPLTAVTDDADDFVALTPAHFLKDENGDAILDSNLDVNSKVLQKRLRYIQSVREAFKKRFRQEYLGVLKASKPIVTKGQFAKVGDIVLIGSQDKKRLVWPLGRITELLSGPDGVPRRARVKTEKGELIRAVQCLYPLEISSLDASLLDKQKQTTPKCPPQDPMQCDGVREVTKNSDLPYVTRTGRQIKPPKHFSL